MYWPVITPLQYEANIRAELFYQIGDQIYGLHMDSGDHTSQDRLKKITTIYRYRKNEKNEWLYDGTVKNQGKVIAGHFFYSIAINYSIYGLNSVHIGDWITSLFHKNDVYQTPIVINPFRDEGNINVNVENDLVSQRLLANILSPVAQNVESKNTLRNLANGKIANYLPSWRKYPRRPPRLRTCAHFCLYRHDEYLLKIILKPG